MDNIRFVDISFAYRDNLVFSHFSAEIEKGRTTFLFGPSGSGKTTLLRLILGLNTLAAGKIEGIDGETVAAIFQEDRLLDHLTAVANVALVLNEGFSFAEIKRDLLAVGLTKEDLEKKVSEFSGGMKRRVALVRAVMTGRSVVVADEPFKGLDEGTKDIAIRYLIDRMKGKTLIVASHDEEDAAKFSANILRIEE